MLILGLKDIAIVERPCRDNFPLEVDLSYKLKLLIPIWYPSVNKANAVMPYAKDQPWCLSH
jgi:hypothetical protein